MVDGDIFREIDEEIKREQFAKLWDKYGYLILATALAVVLSVAGYKYWKHQQAEQAQTYGSRFMEALELAGTDKKGVAQLSFAQIADEGPRGYATLARMRDAALKASSGKMAQAINDYDKLAEDGTVDPVFKGYARIQAAMLRVDDAQEAEMKKRLGHLAEGTSSWRHSARELLGLSAFRAKNVKSAEIYYNQIVGDRTAPNGIRQRAEMMLSLIIEASAEKSQMDKLLSEAVAGDTVGAGSGDKKAPAKTDKPPKK